jgi:hypothetical protein
MHVLLIVIGLLLMLFGGGCVLIVGGFAVSDPGSIGRDPSMLVTGGLFGLLPLAIGWLLFRAGLRIDNRKRRAGVPDLPQQDQPRNNEP